jgi:hypothetical protein
MPKVLSITGLDIDSPNLAASNLRRQDGKRITAIEIARGLGKDAGFRYKISSGKQGCPAMLAGEIDAVARAILDIKGLPACALIGWRLIDLRPDMVEMVLKAICHEANTLHSGENG